MEEKGARFGSVKGKRGEERESENEREREGVAVGRGGWPDLGGLAG